MMRIIYLHQYFFTRNMVSNAGNRSYELARRLVAMGHRVDIVTSYTHATKDSAGGWYETIEEGIHVHWLPVPYSNKMPFQKRIWAFLKFAVGAARKAASLNGDVLYATSGPLTIALPALYASWRKGIPFVFEVRDLWPEGAIQLGVLRNPFAKWGARRLERLAYKRSHHIVALSPGMQEGIEKTGIPASKVTMIPNAADLDLFHPGVDGAEVRSDLGLGDRFALVYFGTMGLANGLAFVLDAAAELKRRGEKGVVFVLHGDGMERIALEARKVAEGIDNVVFSDPVPEKAKIAELAAAVDVCMTIYRNVPVLRTCSPNKMFDALAAGKPVLTNMSGWLGDMAEKDRTGVFVRPDDPVDFADKVVWLRDHPNEVAEFGRNGRKVAEQRFSRDVLAKQLEAVLLNAVEMNTASGKVKAPTATCRID